MCISLRALRRLVTLFLAVSACVFLRAQTASQLTADQKAEIDGIVHQVLDQSGVPSVSLAVVKDGAVVYTQAYGNARLDPSLVATTSMPYSIASISKQFTAAAVLMLQQEGKLSLDDKVGKWLPDQDKTVGINIYQMPDGKLEQYLIAAQQ